VVGDLKEGVMSPDQPVKKAVGWLSVDDSPQELPEKRCSWCGRVLRRGPQPTTHGICPGCFKELTGAEAPNKEGV